MYQSFRVSIVFLLAMGGMAACQNPASTQQKHKEPHPSSSFTLSQIDSVYSSALKETRKINVYLPDTYDANDTTHYPVIYLLDGGVAEDFISVVGIVHFETQEWVMRFPKSIVVGIENTNRKRDFTYAVNNLDFLARMELKAEQVKGHGGSASFIQFLHQELQPYVQQHYKTNQEQMLIGESLGGLLATEILLQHPSHFNRYLILSPSLWWGNESLLHKAAVGTKAENSTIQVYIAAARKEESQIMYDDALALSKKLKQEGFYQVYFDYLPESSHADLLLEGLLHGFKALYPDSSRKQ